eukprot:scaffold81854_cov56-Phaeocystis_antarctica.AAC.4
MPLASTTLMGPACPWCTECLASGRAHASSTVMNPDGLHGSDVDLMAASSSRVDRDLGLVPYPRTISSKTCRRGTGLRIALMGVARDLCMLVRGVGEAVAARGAR